MSEAEEQETPEHFIPYSRADVIDMCLAEERLSAEEADEFRVVCGHLADYLHCLFLDQIDEVKWHYGPFDPDCDTILRDRSASSLADSQKKLAELFAHFAERANYFPVGESELERSFEEETLIKLRTEVDLEDFERVMCFARGDVFKTISRRRFFRTRTQRVDVFQRVLLFLKYKEADYFERAGKKLRTEIQPGKIYLYFYKDVPKWDLEILFPNVRVGMRLKDKLMFGIPALGGTVGVLAKILPQLVILIGAILFFIGARSLADELGVTEESAGRILPVVTAFLGVTMALGGLAVKQWTSYQKKRIEFLRDVAEQLFFRNLANNRSVFHRIIDSAEDEEGKEMILVLYHLMVNREKRFTREELDRSIESWMKEQFGTVIDFDIQGAIDNLERLRGEVAKGERRALVKEDEDGMLEVLSIREAGNLMSTLASRRFRVEEGERARH